jgi:glycosyltransferase involved in cell wall biosynthesis
VNAPVPCRLLRAAKRSTTAGIDAVTAPSRFVLQRHLDHGFFTDVIAEVVPNAHAGPLPPASGTPGGAIGAATGPPTGTATGTEAAGEPASGSATSPADEDGGPVQGLFLGQLDDHKGVPQLLAALEGLFATPELASLRFAFAGRGPREPAVREFCDRHPDRAAFHGMVRGDAKEALLRASRFLVLPSVWNDNFPRTMLEAFAHAMPVVGARRGGIPEVVQDGRSGRIVEPEPDQLAAAIRDYTLDRGLLRRHGAQARVRAEDYTLERQVAAFVALYERVVAGRRTRETELRSRGSA